jgi:hypothetical protein
MARAAKPTTGGASKAAEFWQAFLESPPCTGSLEEADARKMLRKLPDDLDPDLYARLVRHYLKIALGLWSVVGHTPGPLVPVLVQALREDASFEARALLTAHRIGGADALHELGGLIAWFEKSTNLPGLLKRMAGHPPISAKLMEAIVVIVAETEQRTDRLWPFWALAWLAMRADDSIVSVLEQRACIWTNTILGQTDEDVFRRVHASALAADKKPAKKRDDDSTPAPDLPAKVSEAAKWLARHSPIDAPTLSSLGCRPKQNASRAAAAIRSLGLIGTKDALEVLTTYRPQVTADGAKHGSTFGDTFRGPVATELVHAWRRFGREFPAHMFADMVRVWLLHCGTEVEDLSGIEAARGLRDFRVLLGPTCDLEPLTACAGLVRLHLNLALRTGQGGLEPLARIRNLVHLEVFNGSSLADSWVEAVGNAATVERLYIATQASTKLGFLLRLPALRRLRLAAGDDRKLDDTTVEQLRELVHRGTDVALYRHEEWPLALAERLPELTYVDAAGIVLTHDASRKPALLMALRLNAFLEADSGPDLERHLRTQTAVAVPPIAGG